MSSQLQIMPLKRKAETNDSIELPFEKSTCKGWWLGLSPGHGGHRLLERSQEGHAYKARAEKQVGGMKDVKVGPACH
jgi:hypothetical protein